MMDPPYPIPPSVIFRVPWNSRELRKFSLRVALTDILSLPFSAPSVLLDHGFLLPLPLSTSRSPCHHSTPLPFEFVQVGAHSLLTYSTW